MNFSYDDNILKNKKTPPSGNLKAVRLQFNRKKAILLVE